MTTRAGGVGGLLGALALLGALVGVGLGAGGEPARFALVGLQYLPFIALAGLLQLGARWPALQTVAWIAFWLVLVGVAVVSVAFVGAALVVPATGEIPPADLGRLLGALGLAALALLLAAALVLSGRWLALGRWLGGTLERRAAHAQGLIGLLAFTALALAPLVALSGEPPLLRLLAAGGLEPPVSSPTEELLTIWYGLLWTLPLAFLAAGVPLLRTWRQGLARLGLLPLGRRDLGVLVGVALALVGLSLALDAALGALFAAAGWPRTDAGLVEQLFGAAISTAGALTVGVSAGLGEELLARGLLQPRFGWLLPNLAFTAAHGFQYGADGLISVFVTGAVLAAVRARWNTTAAALVHGLFDALLIFGAVLGLPGF